MPRHVPDAARLRALRKIRLLDTPPDEAFDRLTRLGARATGAPTALLSLVDDARQFFKSALGLAEPWAALRETPLPLSLCRLVVEGGAPLVVEDTEADPRTRGHPGVEALRMRAYLGVPLRGPGGEVLGSFCVAAPEPRAWSDEDVRTARDVAAAAEAEILRRRAGRALRRGVRRLRDTRAALRRREEYYRALLDNATDVVDVLNSDGTIRYITPAVERLLGWRPEEMVGKSSFEFVPEAERAGVAARLAQRGRESGAGPRVEIPLLHRDGRVRVFEAQTTNLLDHPAVRGLVVNARDVTDRLAAEAWLRLRERAIEAATQGIVITGPAEEGALMLYANPAFERLTGYAADELLGRNCRVLQGPGTDPAAVAALSRAVAEGRPCTVEMLNYRKDGTAFWNEVSIAPVRDGEGRVTHFVGVQTDVTERERADAALRASEERFRHLVDAVRDHAIVVLDPDGRVVGWNAGAERIHGYPAHEVLGKGAELFYDAADRAAGLPARERAEAAAQGRAEREGWRVRRGGERLWVNSVTSPMRDGAGRLLGFAQVTRDLTERRRADEALRESEARLGGIIASAMDAIISVDEAQRILVFNAAAEAMFGCPAADALGSPLARFIPARHRRAHAGHVARFGHTGVTNRSMSSPGALTALRADGAEFPIEATISQVEAAGEKLYTVIVRDVTERRAAEEELAHLVERELRARERATNILESITDAFFALDRDWRFTYVNAQAEALLGRPRAVLLGQVVWGEFPELAGSEVGDAYRRAVAENRPEHLDARAGALDRWLEIRAYPGREGLSVYMHDVTERRRAEDALRRSEALLRSVMEGISDAIFVKDLEGRYLLANPAFARALGRAADEIVGRTDADFFPADAARVAALNRRVMERGVPESYEETVERPGGPPRRYVMTKVPLLGPDGEVAGLLGLAQDVTARRALEEQLRQSQKMEAVGRLAGGVAHDFNNLLMAIGGHAQLLLRRVPEGDPRRRSLEEIRKGTERAASLTRQLLAFSRQQVLQPRVVDPGAVVEGMEAMLERLIGEDVELVTRLAHTGRVLADPTQLEQVLLNLAVNARDAMPDGGVLVIETADAELGEEDAARHPYVVPGRFVLLAVTDTGHGMDEATRERVFEPFFTTRPDGTGLGLSTVYGVVKQSQGYVWVDSVPGRATTFRVYLPRVDAPAQAPAAPPEAGPAPAGTGTVLLVEDDPGVRALARDALEEAGFTVLAAPDGTAALRLAARHGAGVDVLLTDVVMPGMSGPELARVLRLREPALEVVFMSGYPGHELVRRGTESEGARFLQKPVEPAALVRAVAAAAEARRAG